MRQESTDGLGPDEPEDGWVAAQPLIDSEVIELVLCRFTGRRTSIDSSCCHRVRGQHPDVECRANYLQADQLPNLGSTEFDGPQDEVRQPWRGGEWTGVRG